MSQNVAKEARDAKIALSLASGHSVTQTAKRCRIDPRTVHRLLEKPEFRQQIQTARAAMFDRAAARLSRLGLKAVKTLNALLSAESETIRLGAAREILQAAARLRTLVEFEERLRNLEGRAHEPAFQN